MVLTDPHLVRKWTIYKITNPYGRIYIGKSQDYKKRMGQYRRLQLKRQDLVSRSIHKYGFESHSFEPIDIFEGNHEYAQGKEMFWIRSYMSNMCKYPNQNGMNMTDGGDGALGYKWSEESREKARINATGKRATAYQKKVASEVHKGNKWTVGRIPSEKTRQKMSLSHKGKKKTPEQRLNCKKAQAISRGTPIIVTDSETGLVHEFGTLIDTSIFVKIARGTVKKYLMGELKTKPWIKNRRYTFKYK